MKPILIITTLAIGVGLAACSKPTTTTRLTDSDLERMISGSFAANPELKDVSVHADVDKNEATVSGTVATQDARTQALNLARSASPGLIVTDKIDVKPRELARSEFTEDLARQVREKSAAAGDKIGDTLDDAWIHTKITAKLIGEGDTPARKINVDVVNNVVTLRGVVPTQTAKLEAEKIAKDTDGVKRVVNRLAVKAG